VKARRLRFALLVAGVGLGVGAEIAKPQRASLTALDLTVGVALIGLGLLSWERRPESLAGVLLAGSGFAWFLGNFVDQAVFLHRGVLIHVLLSYPRGRLRPGGEYPLVAAGYTYAAVGPAAGNDAVTIGAAVLLTAAAALRYRRAAGGSEAPARGLALGAAAAFSAALALGAALRLATLGSASAVLWTYDLVVGLVGAALCAGLLSGGWARAAVTGLVVDLGDPGRAGILRDRLAKALGDPSLLLGYWLPDEGRYVDESGATVELERTGRAVTPIAQDGEPVAVLVHDEAVLSEPELVADVAAATRLALANARMQAEVRVHVAEVEASRLRIVEAADEQRRRLEQELREGAERRLARVAELLAEPPLAEIGESLAAARSQLRELARGIHPATLTERGLGAALAELAARSPVPVDVDVPAGRLPAAVEAAAYFVCAEGLTNVAKYAQSARARVAVRVRDGRLSVELKDEGVGGADPSRGSGLRGLADRVEAIGGTLRLESPVGGGTRLTATLPLVDPQRVFVQGGERTAPQ
jgi:signal transduction histidine kinase